MALCVSRAQHATPDFHLSDTNAAHAATIAAICTQPDGIPLAIELAAARVKLLSPTQLLTRLEGHLPVLTSGVRDLEARQQTMRNTVACSEDLLAPKEPRLVWSGSWEGAPDACAILRPSAPARFPDCCVCERAGALPRL
jgi:predicted ATPase